MSAISIFDLDKTLCCRDTFLPFLVFMLSRHPARWWRTPLLGCGVVMYILRLRDNSWLKSFFLQHVIGDMQEDHVASECDRFLRSSVLSKLAKEGLAEVSSRRRDGSLIVLATASPDVYVSRLASMLDIEHVICTRLELSADGRFTGRLISGNCYGPAKHRRIDEFRIAHNAAWADIACYSDHASDLALLLQAGQAYAVNPNRAFTDECRRRNIAVVRWK